MSLSQSEIDSLLKQENGTPGQAAPAAPLPSAMTMEGASTEVARILQLDVVANVTLAERNMTINSILGLTVGSIIEFEEPFDAPLTLNIGNHPIGLGQAVKVGENFGLRVSYIGTIRDRIDAMGGD